MAGVIFICLSGFDHKIEIQHSSHCASLSKQEIVNSNQIDVLLKRNKTTPETYQCFNQVNDILLYYSHPKNNLGNSIANLPIVVCKFVQTCFTIFKSEC